MRYLVRGADGVLYGPVDLHGLRAWVAEGRIGPDTQLIQDGTGQSVPAVSIPELGFGNFQYPRGQEVVGSATRHAVTSLIYSFLTLLICGLCLIPAFYYAAMAARNREPLAGTARIVAWIVAILYIISSIYIIQHLDEFKRVFDMGL